MQLSTTQKRQLFPPAVLSSCTIPPAAVNNTNSYKVPNFNKISGSSPDYRESPQYETSRKFVQSEPRWYMGVGGRTQRCDEANRRFARFMRRRPNHSSQTTALNRSSQTTALNRSSQTTALDHSSQTTALNRSSQATALNHSSQTTVPNHSSKTTALNRSSKTMAPNHSSQTRPQTTVPKLWP